MVFNQWMLLRFLVWTYALECLCFLTVLVSWLDYTSEFLPGCDSSHLMCALIATTCHIFLRRMKTFPGLSVRSRREEKSTPLLWCKKLANYASIILCMCLSVRVSVCLISPVLPTVSLRTLNENFSNGIMSQLMEITCLCWFQDACIQHSTHACDMKIFILEKCF